MISSISGPTLPIRSASFWNAKDSFRANSGRVPRATKLGDVPLVQHFRHHESLVDAIEFLVEGVRCAPIHRRQDVEHFIEAPGSDFS
jgi:hypothetical protein